MMNIAAPAARVLYPRLLQVAGPNASSTSLNAYAVWINGTNHTMGNGTTNSGSYYNGSNGSDFGGLPPPPPSDNAYEFVAFLLWYIFLVVCCIVPTCFAYRHRRLMAARMQEQHDSMNRLAQSNLFILSNLHRHNQDDPHQLQQQQQEDAILTARAQAMSKELEKTTMTVTDDNLHALAGGESAAPIPAPWDRGRIISLQRTSPTSSTSTAASSSSPPKATLSSEQQHPLDVEQGGSDGDDANDDAADEQGWTPEHQATTAELATLETAPSAAAPAPVEHDTAQSGSVHVANPFDEEGGSDFFCYDDNGQFVLSLPTEGMDDSGTEDTTPVEPKYVNANRKVPGTCVICLCQYQTGDEVSWSPNVFCQHAFHKDCIIPWLSKSADHKFNCPVCRQEFCSATIDEAALRTAAAAAAAATASSSSPPPPSQQAQLFVRFPPLGHGQPELVLLHDTAYPGSVRTTMTALRSSAAGAGHAYSTTRATTGAPAAAAAAAPMTRTIVSLATGTTGDDDNQSSSNNNMRLEAPRLPPVTGTTTRAATTDSDHDNVQREDDEV